MMMANNARPGANGGRPGMGIQAKGEQARDFNGTIKRLLQYLRAYRVQLVVVLIFAIASTVFMIVGPKILGQATTKLFEGVVAQIAGTGSVDFVYIGNIIALLAALYIISAFFSYVQGWIMAGVAMKVTYLFRKDIAEKINRMPLK
ncbi:MAG: ABC transporter ATP-binding protein, partial [Chloroflexota bacterium]